MNGINFTLCLTVAASFSVHVAFADAPHGGRRDGGATKGEQQAQRGVAGDARLPPVLPGEVIRGDNGAEIKVWSSAGPVSGVQWNAQSAGGGIAVPQAPVVGGAGSQQAIGGIIVDARPNFAERNTGDSPASR
jgi:hypothetical protein